MHILNLVYGICDDMSCIYGCRSTGRPRATSSESRENWRGGPLGCLYNISAPLGPVRARKNSREPTHTPDGPLWRSPRSHGQHALTSKGLARRQSWHAKQLSRNHHPEHRAHGARAYWHSMEVPRASCKHIAAQCVVGRLRGMVGRAALSWHARNIIHARGIACL
jgi:hypothetical protein